VIIEDCGLTLDKVQFEMLGTAKKVSVSLDDTIILHGGGDKKLIEERCAKTFIVQVIIEDCGLTLDKVQFEMLGTAKKVSVSLDDTIILHGGGDKKLIEERCAKAPPSG
ncbi:chaperonin cpn60-like 2, partial [Quercus suber]